MRQLLGRNWNRRRVNLGMRDVRSPANAVLLRKWPAKLQTIQARLKIIKVMRRKVHGIKVCLIPPPQSQIPALENNFLTERLVRP